MKLTKYCVTTAYDSKGNPVATGIFTWTGKNWRVGILGDLIQELPLNCPAIRADTIPQSLWGAIMKITDFEIVDLGIDHPDCFQGFGVSFTRFEHCTYGIGSTAGEAYDDALDSMAYVVDVDDMPSKCPFAGAVDVHPEDDGMNDSEHQAYYHVGIRWNTRDISGGTHDQ